jgi:hypothetical protein
VSYPQVNFGNGGLNPIKDDPLLQNFSDPSNEKRILE